MSARFRITIPAPLPGTDSARSALPPTPLTWWRRLPPDAFDLDAQRPLRAALLASPSLPLGGWAQACAADPAAAARVALTVLFQRDIDPDRHDAALSAVTLCAALGDPACASILAHALDWQARLGADLTALRLARAWRRQAGMACHLSGR